MKSFVYLFVLICVLASCKKDEHEILPVSGKWVECTGGYLPGEKDRLWPASYVCQDTLLYGMGSYSVIGDIVFNDFWLYGKEGWRRLADFPGKWRYEPVCFMSQGVVYAGLGYEVPSIPYKDIWRYDMQTGVWDSLHLEFPGEKWNDAMIFEAGGKFYYGGGGKADMYVFDPLQGWELFYAERQAASTVFKLNGEVYACFGKDDKGYFTTLRKFNVDTRQWQTVDRIEKAGKRANACAFVLQEGGTDYVYFIGGKPKEMKGEFVWCCRYNFQTREIQEVDVPVIDWVKAAFSQDNAGYVFNGREVYRLVLNNAD